MIVGKFLAACLLVMTNAPTLVQGFSIHPSHPRSFASRSHLSPPAATKEPSDLWFATAAPLVQRYHETFLWPYQNKTYAINYRVEGPTDGPPLLLVHGFGGNVNHFRYNIPVLAEAGYHVHAIDLIGFGGSIKATDVDYSIELFIELLQDFVHDRTATFGDKENASWVLAGNSIGGLCCLGLAREVPELTKGVVLFNCAGAMSGFRYEEAPWFARPALYFMQKVVLQGDWGKQFFADFKTAENVQTILVDNGVYRDPTNVDDELLELLLGPSDDEGAETVFLKVFGGPPGPTPESILPDVQAPILALWGTQDPWTPIQRGMGFYKHSTNFQLQELEGAGHCPHDECPEMVHKYMLPWLDQTQSSYTPPTAEQVAAQRRAEEEEKKNNAAVGNEVQVEK